MPMQSVSDLAQCNIDKIHQVASRIVELCADPLSSEMLLKQLFDEYGLELTLDQYVLVGSTVRSYLAWLNHTGRIVPVLGDNMLRWQSRT